MRICLFEQLRIIKLLIVNILYIFNAYSFKYFPRTFQSFLVHEHSNPINYDVSETYN